MHRWIGLAFLALSLAGCAGSTGSFGGFDRSLNRTGYGVTTVTDPTGSGPSERVQRFELRGGDCFADTGGWSDCDNDRERSELAQRGENRPGSTAWYGWFLYLPDDYPAIDPVKVALGQFHQRGAPPVLMFQNRNGHLYADRQVNGRTTDYVQIIPKEELLGRWHRFEVHARWSSEDSGFITVYVNGEQRYHHEGPTAERPTYFKYGIYRTWVSRFRGGEMPTQVVYYSGVRKGPTRESIRVSRSD